MTCNYEAKSVEEHIYHITILIFRKEVETLVVPLGPKNPSKGDSVWTFTLPETNTAPENQRLEDEFPFGMAHFQGLC